jgi:uncharacterized membrane protein YciS (DUF1049 family)
MISDFMVDQVTVDYRLSKYVLLSALFCLIFAIPTLVFFIPWIQLRSAIQKNESEASSVPVQYPVELAMLTL